MKETTGTIGTTGTGALGRKSAKLGWAAAVGIAAAGLLLGGAREANAFTWNGGRFYFDASGWGQTYVQMMVGHSSYSDCYTMTQIGSSGIYYVDISKWNDATHFAFIGNSSEWGSEGNSIDNRLSYATKRTASYNGSYTFNSSANYLFQKASADNGASISPVYIGDNGFTSVTTPQMVDWYDGSGSSSGNWEQSGYTLWWYNGNSGFRWVNVTNFGAQHVRINNNAISTSHSLTKATTVASLTFGSSATTAHTLGGSYTLTVNGGITNASTASHTVSAPIAMGANTRIDVASGGNLTLSGKISGAYTLTKVGSGTLTLSGSDANTYTKATTVSAGTLVAAKTKALANTGATTVNSGATLALQGGIELTKGITINGTGVSTGGALKNKSGNNTISATVTANDGSRIHVDAGTLTMPTVSASATYTIQVASGSTATIGSSGNGAIYKEGTGTLVITNAANTPSISMTAASPGSVVLASTTDPVNGVGGTLINFAVTNSTGTLVLHKETRIRRVSMGSGSTVQMDVLSTNSAALLGINQNSGWTAKTYSFNGNPHTLKLVLGAGSTFNVNSNASFTVYEARCGGGLGDVITNKITLNTTALGGHAADTNSWTLSLTTNMYGTANAGIKLTYTALQQQAAVGLTQTTFTYAGSAITLTGTGGTGTGAYSYSLVSGSGTLSGSGATCTLAPNAAGSFVIDVTRAASGNYAARTDRVTVTVNKGTQAATSLSQTTFTYAGSNITLTGSGGTAGDYSYALVSGGTGAGTLSGSGATCTLAPEAAGTFYVNVIRAGNNLYNAQTNQVTVTVNKGTQSNTSLTQTTFTYAGSDITLTGSGGTVGAYSYELVSGGTGTGTLSGSGATCTLAPEAAGTFYVNVIRAGNNLYNAKTNQVTVTVNKGNQPTAVTLSTTTFAYSPSGLTLSGSGGTAGTYSYAYGSNGTGSGSVSGSTLSVTAVGTMTVNVTRNGNNLYNSRTDTVTVTVNKAEQTVGFTSSPVMVTAGKSTSVAASVTSPATGGGAVTFSGNAAGVATVTSGGSVTGVAAGQVTITATAAETDFYSAATATYVLTVRAAGPTTVGSITSVSEIGSDTFKVVYTRGNGQYAIMFAQTGSAPAVPEDGKGVNGTVTSGATNHIHRLALSSALAYPYGGASDGTKAILNNKVTTDLNWVFTGATPATHYFLALYERNPNQYTGASATNWSYSATAATADFWTLSTEPTGNPSMVTPTEGAGTLGSGSATINWTKGTGANNTLVVIYGPADTQAAAEALSVTAPTDGQVYSGSALGGTVLHAGTGTSAVASGLTKLKWYKVVAYSYATGADNSTANYLTPGASITFKTLDSNGPLVWATGVDETSFLLNWTNLVDAANGYTVEFRESEGTYGERMRVVFTNNFTSGEGWSAVGYTNTTKNPTLRGDTWQFRSYGTTADGAMAIQPASTTVGGDTGNVFLGVNNDYVMTPIRTGLVSKVRVLWRSAGGPRKLTLYSETGANYGTETALETFVIDTQKTTQTNEYVFSTPLSGGVRFKLKNSGGSSGTYAGSVFVGRIEVFGPQYGHSDPITGLTDGTTYEARVQNAPNASDWSDVLSVKAGVVPTGLATGAVTRSSAAFSWSGANSPSGYRWQATTNAAAAWSNQCTDGDALTGEDARSLYTNEFKPGRQWMYIGTTAGNPEAGAGGSVRYTPRYINHQGGAHYLSGKAGLGIQSTNFPIAGATNITLSYTIINWNLGITNAFHDMGRVDAYYRLDDGPWCFLGTGLPAAATDATTLAQSFKLDKGYLDGTTIAFKVVAPNAGHGLWGGDRLVGPGVQALRVDAQVGGGDYTTLFAEGTDSGSATVEGLSPSSKVYFRVQALQGANVRSVWVETQSETGAVEGPANVEVTGATKYTLTAEWDPVVAEGYDVTYNVKLSRCGLGESGPVTNCPDGSSLGKVSSDSAWWYRMSKTTGGATGVWPQWSKSGHALRAAQSSIAEAPGVATPTLDMSRYSSAKMTYQAWSYLADHTYDSPHTKVYLHWRVNGGAWSAKDAEYSWGVLTSQSAAEATACEIAVPPESLQANVQYLLSADDARVVDVVTTKEGVTTTNHYNPGPTLASIVLRGTVDGAGDFLSEGCVVESADDLEDTEYTFGETTPLVAGTNYYVQVVAVLSTNGVPLPPSDGSEAIGTTLAPQSPPDWIHGEDIKQTQMTLAWAEAEDAAGYQWELTRCAGDAWTRTVLAATPTNRDLTDGDSWHYIGGGTPVAAVEGEKDSEATYITAAGATYPAWANGPTGANKTNENSIVLAGEGAPGIESEEFSTVGAQEGTLSFRFGRWYASTEELGAAHTPLTVSYSLDGGASWAQWFMTENAYEYEYTRPVTGKKYGVVSNALPSALLGQRSVMLRIVAEGAGIADSHARGAAIAEAQLQLGGRPGSYDNGDEWTETPPAGTCTLASGTTGADGLTAHVTGLATNTEYYFRVRATDGTQYGAWVDGKATTLNGPATPEAPWATDIGRHTMTIQWLASDRAETYTLAVYTNEACTAPQTNITGIAGTSQIVTGLKAETTYWFKVRAHADGTDSAWSTVASAKTVDTVAVTGLRVEDIMDTSMTVKWDHVGGTTYTMYWGTAVTEGATDSREEVIACPAKTLERSDAGNKWFYLGGNGTYPAYWTSSGNPTNDQGHALIQNSGGQPAIQSRWFSTFGATNATVEFLHGRFNVGADSSVTVSYSVDGGTTWATAGTAPSTAATNPSVARAISLPASALGRRSVAVRLTADKASGTLGAHLKDVKVVVRTGSTGTGTPVASPGTGSWTVPGTLEPGTRYWFRLVASEAGDTAEAVTTAATRTKTTGAVKSQGFEGPDGNAGLDTTGLDTIKWNYTTNFYTVGSKVSKAWAAGDPTVTVAKDENPLYGDRAIRLSGSASAGVYGVVEFANYATTAGSSLTVTVPFAARNLANGENLWFSYSTNNGTTWDAPAGTTVRTNGTGWLMGKIATGGSDVINQNWPYNHGINETTRRQGDAYVFTVDDVSQLAVRIAFCGNRGSADHYYYIDEVKLTRNPGDPSDVSATAQDSGGILLGWTPPEGDLQGVVILRGRDERHVPTSPIDLANLPHGYEIVTNATGGVFWPNTTSPGSCLDMNAISGWRYFYYFYGAISTGDGYMLRPEPKTANAMVKGMVDAIASMGWDGWDIHPWPYTKGRVTDLAVFSEPSQNAGKPTWETGSQYSTLYGNTNQLDIYERTNYYGTNSFRLSGGSCVNGVNSNNAAIQFENIDLSGYKNVEFSLHFAGDVTEGGDDMHVAISTNGGTQWLAVSRTNEAMWRSTVTKFGMCVGDSSPVNGGHWDFYFEDFVKQSYPAWDGGTGWAIPTPEGNPYWLRVPDNVTQFMARVMFFDSQGANRWNKSYYIDEVRLFGEAALETPHPRMEAVASNSFVVAWDAVPDATSYDVRVTSCAASGDDAVKLTQAFVLSVVTNGWTTSGSTDVKTSYDHTGSGYGLAFTGTGGTLTSPETGAARTLEFWSKAVSANSNSKLQVEVSADGTAWEVVTNYTAASSASATAIGSSWVKKSVDLPHRQWSRVRFKLVRTSDSTGNFYLDDIKISGGGDYETGGCLVKEYTGLTGTSQGFTNGTDGVTLSPGTPYYVEVRANGTPGGYLTHSPWGETGDYTAGDFHAVPDGFEMVRLTWAAPSSGSAILVMAVPEGFDYSDVTAPTNTAVGGINGKGVVLTNTTAAVSGAGFEHVRPYGSRTEDYEAKYVVYWKHGGYWEGRLETSATLGTYVAQVAEAFAYTNGTAMTAIGSQSAFNVGKGWTSAWEVTQVPWSGAWAGQETRNNSQPYGLVATNKLWGAGGNMLVLYPTNNNTTASVKRALSAPLRKNAEWWGMFTMKVTYSGNNKWAGMQLLNKDGQNKASIGKLWGGSAIGVEGNATYTSSQTIGDAGTKTIVFHWDKSKMYLKTFAGGTTFNPTDGAPAFDGSVALSMDDIYAIQLVAQNGSGVLYPVWFDEIRLGATWEELVGKQTEPPLPVSAAEAWADGKELVRIAWQYQGGLTNGSVINPLADGVKILAKDGDEGEWYEIYKGPGTNATPARNAWSRWDHVVAPGSSHQYQVVAYAGGRYTNGVDAVNRDAPETTTVTMGLYGATEYLETISYTNNTDFSAGVWTGGHGFGDTPSAWTLQSDNTGTWTSVNPETAQAAVHITNVVQGSRLAVGNVLKATVDFGQKAGLERQLGGDAWCGGAGQAFYVAFRMAYEWGQDASAGHENEWGRRAGMRITDTNLKYVEVGKARGDADGDRARFGVTATANGNTYSTGWTANSGSMRGFGDAGATNAFLVVAKVYWTAAGKADIRAGHFAIGDAAHPATLPGDEADMTWTATYSNAVISNVRKLELIAQCEDSEGKLGSAYFDEIRYGTTWEDIIGATEPEDVWTAGTTNAAYKGDFATWEITSKPHGPKQSAWVALARDTAFTTSVSSNSTTWLRKEQSGTNWHSVWQGHELQFTATGTWYGGGVVKGELVTVKSWERPAAWGYRWNQYDVAELPNPTKTNNASASPEVFQGDAKLGLAWSPATVGGRTFPEVMIVRFPDDAAAWSPADGTVYMKGASAGAGTVVYRGTNETTLVDKGLGADTWYRYQFYTVNNSHYSPGVSVSMNTSTNVPAIEIDGDPNDWIGEPSEVKNSSTTSQGGEWIWTDKVGDGRKDIAGAYDADITEFRIKVDSTNVYFMARLHCLTNPANPYIAVGITTNVNARGLAETGNETGENWLGDEANTFLGGNLFSPASLHYADIQMTVHQVAGTWQVELFKKDGSSWYGPGGVGDVSWQAASSAAGAEDPCIEWKLHRSDLGLNFGSVTPARFTVASFVNSGGWNNDVVGTTKLSDGTSYAVDTLAIAPWGVNDKDLALTAWDEGIKNNNAEYWFDIWFGPTALHNASPSAPALSSPPNNATNVSASPTMTWDQAADGPSEESNYRGFVVGYLVEVSTNALFNGLEGTTENGPVSCRVNVCGATNTSYRYITDSREYWWRVRARDNSGALSAPTPWHYVVSGKTDNEGPEPRLLYVGTNVTAFLNNTGGYRDEQERSGDATSVLDSELENGGHDFGFVIEWYDINGVYATNHMHDQLGCPTPGAFAFNILDVHADGTPYGRVSPNWDLVIVDRAATNSNPSGVNGKPANEQVGSHSLEYVWPEGDGLVLPTDDGGTETVQCWYIDGGLDNVFHNDETRCDGNFGQLLTNYVVDAFSIGNYRTSLDIYLTVSAEDGCTNGGFTQTQWYTPPVYDTETGSAGSYETGPIAGAHGSVLSSGWCADFPHPERNITTNRLLHIHVRDNDAIPPTASTAKWRAAATNEAGEALLPMVAVATGTTNTSPWDPTWANLDTNGLTRLPTYEGQGKSLQWQLTDGDVAVDGVWRGTTNKLNFFFNVYDEYLHSGMQTNTVAGIDYVKTISTSPLLKRTNWLDSTGMILKNPSSGNAETNYAPYAAWLSQNLKEGGSALHGEGTDPNTVLAWRYDSTEADVQKLLGATGLLSDAKIGVDSVTGDQRVVTNALKLYAWDSDNNAAGDQEGAEIEFGQLIFTDDDATAPEAVGFTSFGTGTNYTHFGDVAKWKFSADTGEGYTNIVTTTNPLMRAISMSAIVTGRVSSASSSPDSDSPATVMWNSSKNAIYLQGNMNADQYRADNARYFWFQVGGDGTTTWKSDMLAFYNRVSPTGPTKFALTMQGAAGISKPAVTGTDFSGDWGRATDATATLTVTNISGSYSRVVRFDPTAGGVNSSATLTSPAFSCKDISSLTLEYTAGKFANKSGNTASTYLYVEYGVSTTENGTPVWIPAPLKTFCHNPTDPPAAGVEPGWSSTLSMAEGNHTDVSFDLFSDEGGDSSLKGTDKWVTFRFRAVGLGGSGGAYKAGFGVVDPKVTAGDAAGSAERLLGTIEVEKTIASEDKGASGGDAAETVGSYANTETDVILGFNGQVVGTGTNKVTFRLYGYGATRLDAETGEIKTDYTQNGTWAIKNLYLHGTATEPKHSEVTDYDVHMGAWTNRLEVMDGTMGGYDTTRSGLRVEAGADESPSFRILYPTYYANTAPSNAYPNGTSEVVVTGNLSMRAAAAATFDALGNADFDTAAGWTLSADEGTAIAGGKLTLPGNDTISSASRWLNPLTSMEGVTGVTIAGTVRVKGTTKADAGGTNTLTVTAQPYDSSGVTVGDLLTTNITANASWKNYPVGPWTVPGATVAKVLFTVKQTDTTSTEMLVDELRMRVAQWGADISAEDPEQAAAFAAAVTNGMEAAKLLVRTPELELGSTALPLSTNHTSTAGAQPAADHYRLEATIRDYDHDRAGDSLSASATTNFWLYDDDTMRPQFGSKYGGPLGVFMNGTIIPQAWRWGISLTTNSAGEYNEQDPGKLEQRWPITDAELTAMGTDDPVTFALSFYDYSGWYAKALQLGDSTNGFLSIQTDGAVDSAAESAGWSAPDKNDGEAEDPGATSTWSIGAKAMYDAYSNYFAGDYSGEGRMLEVKAEVWDKDDERQNDALAFWDTNTFLPKRVGYVWFADQDVWAPRWGGQTTPYYGVMLSTNVPNSAEGYAAMVNTNEGSLNPYAVGGIANNQTENFAGRSYTVWDGDLNDLNAPGNDKVFAITANLNDPLSTGEGARARKVSGLQRGSSLTERRAMWGDDPGSPSDAKNVFTITNTHVVLSSGTAAITNVAFNNTFSEPVSKTRVAMQAGHTTWTWSSFPTNDIGLLLPTSEDATVQLTIQAYDSDMNRHGDQSHVELTGPTITLKDDDTTNPNDIDRTTATMGGAAISNDVDRFTAKWYNETTIGGWDVTFTPVNDATNLSDHAQTGSGIDGYKMMKWENIDGRREAGGTTGTNWMAPGVSLTTLRLADADGGKKTATLANTSGLAQGLTTQLVFAVDGDCDRPYDQRAGAGIKVPLAFDKTPPPVIGTEPGKRLVADPDNTDDPTTQFDLTWPTKVGDNIQLGPDDTGHDNHPLKGDTTKYDYLSPWYSYKIYYTNYEESAIASDDSPTSESKSWVYTNFITTKAYMNWTSVTASAAAADPTAPTNSEGRSVAYSSLGVVSNNASAEQKIRLYDLDFDQHYVVVIVGVDKAGNEGPAGMWSWATNNTIKFALTQGVVRASAAINRMLPTNTTDLAYVGMAPIGNTNAVKKGVVLSWLASGQDARTGAFKHNVTKEYDLIYRDAKSFNEKGTEQWSMASSGSGAGANQGTSRTNWNYQVDSGDANSITNLSREKLRFYRASYKGRWNPPSGGRPLASEEVYSMNRVPLKQGPNYVGLQGVPYVNTLMGVFGTNWPAGDEFADSTRVEFFRMGANGLASVKQYWLMATNGVHSWRDTGGADVTDSELPSEFFGNGFSITLPDGEGDLGDLKDFEVDGTGKAGMWWYPILQVPTNGPMRNPSAEGWFTKVGNTYTLSTDTSVAAGTTYYAGKAAYTEVTNPPANANPKAQGWYETKVQDYVLSEDTAAVSGKTYWQFARGTYSVVTPTAGANPHESGWYEFVWIGHILSQDTEVQGDKAYWTIAGYTYLEVDTSTDGLFSVEVTYGGKREGARSTLISLSLPVATHVKDLGLVQTNAETGEWEGGFLPGNGFEGDAIYTYDNLTGKPRSIIYYDENETNPDKRWKTVQGKDLYIRPNDAMVILSMGGKNKKAGSTWTWTYRPSDFYSLPTRWMGR